MIGNNELNPYLLLAQMEFGGRLETWINVGTVEAAEFEAEKE